MTEKPELPKSTDVVIIGGGLMGTSIAYFLQSRSDKDVLLLEKDNIAAGSTSDSSAILRHHYTGKRKKIYSKMAWWSHQFYLDFEEKTGQKIAHAKNPRVRFGRENTEEGQLINEGYEVLQSLDIPSSKYDKDKLSALYPMFADHNDFDFAISDDAAAYSDGTDAANGFARAAAELGVDVRTGISANNILTAENSVIGILTECGTVSCETIIVAAGPWSSRLADCIDVDLPITPTREQIIILEPNQDYKDQYLGKTPTIRISGSDWYMRPDFGNGVLMATHYGTEQCSPDKYKKQPDEDKILEAINLLNENVPGLNEAKLKGRYCGVYSMTPDHDFIIDQVGPDGCYFATGFSGHGFKHGPAVGKIVSDMVLYGDTDFVDLNFFSLNRFKKSPDGHGRPNETV